MKNPERLITVIVLIIAVITLAWAIMTLPYHKSEPVDDKPKRPPLNEFKPFV